MSAFEIETKVKACIAKILTVKQDQFRPGVTLVGLGADSLDIVEIGMELEEAFAIAIDQDELDRVMTASTSVDDIIKYIGTRVA